MARDRVAHSMSRRSFCRASVGVLIAPGSALSQGMTQVRRIGVLQSGAPESPEVLPGRFEIIGAAMKHGLPTMAEDQLMVREGGALVTYGRSQVEEDRLHAEYIDRILRGARPADLPVQQPTKFELAINLKTARALGLTIPKELLLRADEVIQ